MGVVGSGQMGTGIGIVASRVAGVNVKFVDPSDASLKRSEAFINSWCDKEIAKQKMTAQDKTDVLSRVSFHNSIEKLNDVDFAVEVSQST